MRRVATAGAVVLAVGCGSGNDMPTDDEVVAPDCSGTPGTEVDLARVARLAGQARAQGLFAWVREADDGIGAVRDDFAGSSYKPVFGEATVEIDLQPLVGHPVRLSRLAVDSEGPLSKLRVDVLAGCGAKPHRSFEATGSELALEGACGGCVELHLFSDEEIAVSGLELWSDDGSIELAPASSAAASIGHARSGVIEGFYGVPWSWRERQHMLESLAHHGLGFYLYAPKDDPLHRGQWRSPYPEGFVQRFGELARFADARGVRLWFGISPFVDYDSRDYQALLDKLVRFVDAGVTGVGLLADDIEFSPGVEVDGALGQLHVQTANQLLADLRAVQPAVQLLFVPTVYSDSRLDGMAEGEAYLAELTALDPDIPVMWTGTNTSSSTMTAADMQRVTSLIGKPPLIWDNYWANDGGDGFKGRILLGTLEGRGPALPDAVAGLAFNPSIQGAVSRLSVATAAHWLDHPTTADPEAARQQAVEGELGFSLGAGRDTDRDRDTLLFTMHLFDGNTQRNPSYPALTNAIGALTAALEAGATPVAEATELLRLAGRMAAYESEVHHSGLDPDLVDELAPAAPKVRLDGEAALWLLAALARKQAGDAAAFELEQAQLALDASDLERFQLGSGELYDLRAAVAQAPEKQGGVVVLEPSAPPGCVLGQELDWQPFASPVTLEAWGLPGARIESHRVRFEPPHAGRYRAVVTATSEAGWGFANLELVCR